MQILWMVAAALILTGCASADGPAEKETHVIPQQSTGAINLTVPSPPVAEEKSVPTVHNYFYGPLVSIRQEMRIDDAALKGGDMSAEGGEAEQRTDPSTTIPVAQQGGQINLESQTEGAKATQDNRVDKTKTDSENTTSTETTVIEAVPSKKPVNPGVTLGGEPIIVPESGEVESWVYETKFDHTQTAGSDGGKSLVMCPDETRIFDSCSADGVDVPYHGRDEGRITYWNMTEEPAGEITCTLGDEKFRYPAGSNMVYGEC